MRLPRKCKRERHLRGSICKRRGRMVVVRRNGSTVVVSFYDHELGGLSYLACGGGPRRVNQDLDCFHDWYFMDTD